MSGPEEQVSWESFGVGITRLRKEAGMTVQRLSDASFGLDGSGISNGFVSRLGNDLDRPTPAVVERLAHALGVAPEYFLAYRLAQARGELDELGPGGVEGAARRLREISNAPPAGRGS